MPGIEQVIKNFSYYCIVIKVALTLQVSLLVRYALTLTL